MSSKMIFVKAEHDITYFIKNKEKIGNSAYLWKFEVIKCQLNFIDCCGNGDNGEVRHR